MSILHKNLVFKKIRQNVINLDLFPVVRERVEGTNAACIRASERLRGAQEIIHLTLSPSRPQQRLHGNISTSRSPASDIWQFSDGTANPRHYNRIKASPPHLTPQKRL